MPIVRRLRSRWNHFGILAVSLLATGLATFAFYRSASERDAARFQNAVESTQDRIQSRLGVYVNLLIGTRSFFMASSRVELRDFREYVDHLNVQRRYPGIQGIGFSRRISPSEVANVTGDIRAQGQTDFLVWPAYPRDEYHSILFLEPMDRRNRAAIGYDMFTEAVRRDAMTRARDTGAPAVTHKVTLVQEIEPLKQPGFLIYVPVYAGDRPVTLAERRNHLLGYVYSPFRAVDFFNGIFGTEQHPRVAFDVFDGTEVDPEAVLYRSSPVAGQLRFQTTRPLSMNGSTWTLVFRTTAAFDAQSNRRFVPVVLGSGLLASAILFLLAASLRKSELALADSEVRTRTVLETALDAVVGMDTAGRVIDWNAHAETIFGWPRNEVLGRSMAELIIPTSMRQRHEQGLSRFMSTGDGAILGRRVELTAIRRDGTEFPVELAVTTVQHEGSTLFYAFIRDISHRKSAEDERVRLIEELEGAVRVRDEFLSIASHELRTPLTALELHLGGMQRAFEREAATEARDRSLRKVGMAIRQADRLTTLVEDLLNVSRIDTGRFVLEINEFDLVGLVREVAERFEEQAKRVGSSIEIRVPDAAIGRWDRARLDQVLTNLLSNAVKYGSGKSVEVALGADDRSITLAVHDDGIGIAPEDLSRVFGRFERAVSSSHYGGLGLGLYITRQIVAAHGGTIEVESRPGKGTTFIVVLPRHGIDVLQSDNTVDASP